jgi:hypothetical protein
MFLRMIKGEDEGGLEKSEKESIWILDLVEEAGRLDIVFDESL